MRSDVVKKGIPAAPNRSLLYALGYTKEELERPLIGVVCSYNEIVPGHTIELRVSDEELSERHAKWVCPEPKVKTGYLARYAKMVSSADKGAILE